MKSVPKNLNTPERWARAVIAIFLLPAVFFNGYDVFTATQTVAGLILVYNALSGICWTSRIFGIKTCQRS